MDNVVISETICRVFSWSAWATGPVRLLRLSRATTFSCSFLPLYQHMKELVSSYPIHSAALQLLTQTSRGSCVATTLHFLQFSMLAYQCLTAFKINCYYILQYTTSKITQQDMNDEEMADSITWPNCHFDDYVIIHASDEDSMVQFIQLCSQISEGNCHVFDSTSTNISTLITTWSLEYMHGNITHRLRYVIVNMNDIPVVSSKCWHRLAGWTPMLHTKVLLFARCLNISKFPNHLKQYAREELTVKEWTARELMRSNDINIGPRSGRAP